MDETAVIDHTLSSRDSAYAYKEIGGSYERTYKCAVGLWLQSGTNR